MSFKFGDLVTIIFLLQTCLISLLILDSHFNLHNYLSGEVIFLILLLYIIYDYYKSRGKAKKHTPKPSSIPKNTPKIQQKTTNEELFLKYKKLAQENLDKKNYNLAIRFYNKAINLNSSDPKCFLYRAYCKSQIGDYLEAIRDYSEAINLNGNKEICFANRGIIYWRLGKQEEAIEDLETAALLGVEYAKRWLSEIGHYKEDWQEFEKIIIKEGIYLLYHFTDRANLDSILKYGGLFSWHTCDIKGIEIPVPGVNKLSRNLDRRKKLHDYVRLSFNKNHPMLHVAKREGRIKNPFFLEISPEVIYLRNTIFSNQNATSNSALIGGDLQTFQRINFTLAKYGKWSNQIEKKHVQAEVLVKSHIPIKFIKIILLCCKHHF